MESRSPPSNGVSSWSSAGCSRRESRGEKVADEQNSKFESSTKDIQIQHHFSSSEHLRSPECEMRAALPEAVEAHGGPIGRFRQVGAAAESFSALSSLDSAGMDGCDKLPHNQNFLFLSFVDARLDIGPANNAAVVCRQMTGLNRSQIPSDVPPTPAPLTNSVAYHDRTEEGGVGFSMLTRSC